MWCAAKIGSCHLKSIDRLIFESGFVRVFGICLPDLESRGIKGGFKQTCSRVCCFRLHVSEVYSSFARKQSALEFVLEKSIARCLLYGMHHSTTADGESLGDGKV